MIDRIRIRTTGGYDHYRDDPFEVMEIGFRTGTYNVPLAVPYMIGMGREETRRDFGYRLRRAASEASQYVERQLIDHLKQMGHVL